MPRGFRQFRSARHGTETISIHVSALYRPEETHTPEVQSIFDFVDRAAVQLKVKEDNLKSLRDHERHYEDQANFIKVLRRALDRLPPGQRVRFIRNQNLQEFEADKVIENTWINWYSLKRAQGAQLEEAIESGLREYPEFEITGIEGEFPDFVVSSNIDVFELKYRTRQAVEFFKVLYNIHCNPNPAPLPGVEFPQNSDAFDPARLIHPRFEHCKIWFDSAKTIREACVKIIELFLVSVVKHKEYPKYLPVVPFREGELPGYHVLCLTVD